MLVAWATEAWAAWEVWEVWVVKEATGTAVEWAVLARGHQALSPTMSSFGKWPHSKRCSIKSFLGTTQTLRLQFLISITRKKTCGFWVIS